MKTCSVCNSITQVIDLMEGIRCCALPFLCERIIEVPVRDWLVIPAMKTDGQYCTIKAPNLDEHLTQKSEASDEAEQGDFKQNGRLIWRRCLNVSSLNVGSYFRRQWPKLQEYSLHRQTSSCSDKPHRSDLGTYW